MGCMLGRYSVGCGLWALAIGRWPALCPAPYAHYIFFPFDPPHRSARLETHGPLGTLWVSIGLGLFYIALIWLNTLLGFVLTPLFIIPATWLTDRMPSRRRSTPS